MITNERQYKVTRSQAAKFEEAVKRFDELALIEQGLDPLLIKAQLNALTSQLEELRVEISNYEALSSGNVTQLTTDTLDGLGGKIIEARIAKGLSQKALAERLGMKEQQIQRYEQEKYASASLSRLSEVCGALAVNCNLELLLGSDGLLNAENWAKGKIFELGTSEFPTNIMRKRGWFKDALPEAVSNTLDSDTLLSLYMLPAFEGASPPALLRRGSRLSDSFDACSLLAWKARIVWKARAEKKLSATPSDFSNLSWLQTFKEFSLREDGPALAVEFLRTKGVLVLFEAHLPRTHLDGAALLVDDHLPTIALTLRHDRLDNFWFVLLHELGHILLHRKTGLNRGFFDDDELSASEKLEREADEFAKSIFLPEERWKTSLVRFTQSSEQIAAFAHENRLSPAIVAGWIRRDRKDYSIFKELVGYGKVRSSLDKAGMLETANVSRT